MSLHEFQKRIHMRRFTQPPQAGVAPSHRRFRARHSSHANEARLRTDFFLEFWNGGLGSFCSLRLAGVSLLISAGSWRRKSETSRMIGSSQRYLADSSKCTNIQSTM